MVFIILNRGLRRGGGAVALYFGREESDWDQLEDIGLRFLIERARLQRVTSYTEMNQALAQRTGLRSFDFDLESDRAAMGYLLGRVSDHEYPQTGLLITALVHYLDANDAGAGFYKLARSKGLISPRLSRNDQWEFWVGHVAKVHAHYSGKA
jgi:hypothetical protein